MSNLASDLWLNSHCFMYQHLIKLLINCYLSKLFNGLPWKIVLALAVDIVTNLINLFYHEI
jgi:hypothetical protein